MEAIFDNHIFILYIIFYLLRLIVIYRNGTIRENNNKLQSYKGHFIYIQTYFRGRFVITNILYSSDIQLNSYLICHLWFHGSAHRGYSNRKICSHLNTFQNQFVRSKSGTQKVMNCRKLSWYLTKRLILHLVIGYINVIICFLFGI